MRRAIFGMAICCVLAAVSGPARSETVPASVWPMFQYRGNHNAVFDEPRWNVAWKADIGDRNNGGLSIVGDTIFVQSFDHKVFAFDALTGQRRWSSPVDDIAMATTLVDRDIVYAGTGTGASFYDDGKTLLMGRPQGNAVYALDRASGKVVWRFGTVGHDMPSGVLVADGTRTILIFHNGDGHIRALDAQSGKLLWERAATGSTTMSSLALDGGKVYGVTAGTTPIAFWKALAKNDSSAWSGFSWTWAIRASDGAFLWKSPHGFADGSATVADDIVFVEDLRYESVVWTNGIYLVGGKMTAYPDLSKTMTYSEVAALAAGSGRLLWKYDGSPGLSSFVGSSIQAVAGMYAGHTYYDALPFSRELAAFDGRTGRVRWKLHTQFAVKMSPVLKAGLLYFGDSGGRFYVVSASDGDLKRTISFSDPFGCSPPVIVGETLFVTNGRTLYALRLADLR